MPRLIRVLPLVVVCALLVYVLLPGPESLPKGKPETGGEVPTFFRRVVAVGDLHGDLPNALKVLKMNNVIDDNHQWTGEVDFLVQTGDIIDRGDDTILLYQFMEDLRNQARSFGGDVISHLGNHEIMNSIGDWRYVWGSEIKTFGSVAERQRIISTGWIGAAWRTNYTITSRLPLHPSLGPPNTDYTPSGSPLSHAALSFVHGGISPTFMQATPYPSRINNLGSSLLSKLQRRKQPPPHPPNPYPGLPTDASKDEHELYGSNGPLWYRGWALEDERKVCKDIDAVLDKTGTRHLIMGHTPTFDRQVSRCKGKIIIIDTGISHAYGGVLSALRIEYTLTPVKSREYNIFGRRIRLLVGGERTYLEREVINAVYPHKTEQFVVQEREVAGDFA
ncbi:Metallo-dependent phosphatase-like protein [Cantharellus anzutake]|uniref:Metallo-dependent phosphatase-like protein n=1 Tax=Cantharellus anzutake TaxID=1750568 RepID=UPI001907D4BB|nr:Metallo-dependent phosphatase-like protein [Cantharellus anzutake]KAF8340427.1 Metallo-dependent phosphatase-like protein [Cantharellus anzutake]